MSKLNERALCNRATAAYFRSAAQDGGSVIQPSEPEYVTHKGLDYIRLSNTHETLAVYRVRIVKGEPVLKGLKRWPSELGVL